jgi:hypothetical protein
VTAQPVPVQDVAAGDVLAVLDGSPWLVVLDPEHDRGSVVLGIEPQQGGSLRPVRLEADAIVWRIK